MNKKRDRKKSKKTKQTKKNALLDKYKNEIHQNLDVESKTVLNLIKNKKVKNLEENEDDAYFKDNTYEKDNLVLQILDEKPKFNRVPKEILDFKQKHFFGGRIRRTNLNKILSRK